jgi:hypothetical protein
LGRRRQTLRRSQARNEVGIAMLGKAELDAAEQRFAAKPSDLRGE